MKKWPVSLLWEVPESMIGRGLAFFFVFFIGATIGLSIAAKEVLIPWMIVAYVPFSAFALLDLKCLILSIVIGIIFFVYIRFEPRPRLLIPVVPLVALHAYLAFQQFH
jgi:fructose-specific phosphotransferase system IIC component